MSCIGLTGFPSDCGANIGGVKKLWIAQLTDVASVTINGQYSHIVDSIAMFGGARFVEWRILPGNCSYTVNGSRDDFGVIEWLHTVTVKLNRRLGRPTSIIWDTINGSRDLVCLILDANGNYWLLGWPFGMYLIGEGGSGTNKSDGSTYSMTFSGESPKMELLISEDDIPNIT